jgi:hypothetical protein
MTKLTSEDHQLLDVFLGTVLDRYKEGALSRGEAIGRLAHLVSAIDQPDTDDPRAYMSAVIVDEGEGA